MYAKEFSVTIWQPGPSLGRTDIRVLCEMPSCVLASLTRSAALDAPGEKRLVVERLGEKGKYRNLVD